MTPSRHHPLVLYIYHLRHFLLKNGFFNPFLPVLCVIFSQRSVKLADSAPLPFILALNALPLFTESQGQQNLKSFSCISLDYNRQKNSTTVL